MAQQTAVEWLVEQLRMQTPLYTKIEMIEMAKQMEKEQMKNMWRGGQWSVELGGEFEQYYNETYNK